MTVVLKDDAERIVASNVGSLWITEEAVVSSRFSISKRSVAVAAVANIVRSLARAAAAEDHRKALERRT